MNKNSCKSSVKLKASRPEFTVEKKNLAYLIVYLKNIILIMCNLKQGKHKYIFSNNQWSSTAYRVHLFLFLFYSNLYSPIVYDKAPPV